MLSDLAQRTLHPLCKHRASRCLQHFVDRARDYSGPRVIIELCLCRCVKGSYVRIRDEVKKVVAAIDFVMLLIGRCGEVLGLIVGKEIVRSTSDRCCMDVKVPPVRSRFAKNLYEKVPKTQWPMVSAMFQTIFQQPDAQSTWAQAREVVDLLEPKFPQVSAYLEESLDEGGSCEIVGRPPSVDPISVR